VQLQVWYETPPCAAGDILVKCLLSRFDFVPRSVGNGSPGRGTSSGKVVNQTPSRWFCCIVLRMKDRALP